MRTCLALLLLATCLLLAGCADTTATDTPAPSPTPVRSPSATPATTHAPTVTPSGLTQATVVRVVDGDTIGVVIGGEEYTVRYIGIDTPETVHPSKPVQCFGIEASEHNKQLVEGQTVGLEKDVSETDQYGRLLRYVWLGGEMVNAALVRDGYAYAATFPPDVRYQETFLELQREARDAGRGLWGAECVTGTPTPGVTVAAGTCEYSGTAQAVIKGNISSSGEKIYHVPGQENYEITVISETKGERWFCTEAEAVAAGWRKAQR